MSLNFFAPCPKGLESLLLNELADLGVEHPKETVAGVAFDGDFSLGMKVCLWSRFASRVLLQLSEFYCQDDTDLYLGAYGVAWEKYFDAANSIAVTFSGSNDELRNTQYGALKVKDAICDRFVKTSNSRPSVNKEDPDVQIYCHLSKKQDAVIAIDLSGRALMKRDYHRATGIAPLKENLAAAMIARSKYAGGNFLDPMCGSGTLLLEAASLATDTAPGLKRSFFGFFKLKQFEPSVWESLKQEAFNRSEQGIKTAIANQIEIIGFDQDERVVALALQNAEKSGFGQLVKVFCSPIDKLYNPFSSKNPITIVTNPPYGKRMGNFNELIALYASLGAGFKEHFKGAVAAVISSSKELLSCMRLHALKVYKLFNGELECQLRVFEINADDGLSAREESNLKIAEDFANRLKKNLAYMRKWANNANTNAYRVYDADVPEYNAAIDFYNGYYVIQAYAASLKVNPKVAKRRILDMISATVEITGVPGDMVILKNREIQKGDSQYEKSEEQKGKFIEVRENNALFRVNLEDYLDTGLFLDGRIIRDKIRSMAKGLDFLNLFAYTASASVAAALGGAKSTLSVDMSQTYLKWGIENFRINHLSLDNNEFIQADCLAWLSRDQGRQFDLIYIDPPTFSNSKRMQESFDVRRDHVKLLSNLVRHLKDGGKVIFCTNRRGFKLDDAVESYGFKVTDISKATLPRDFWRDEKIHSCFFLEFDRKNQIQEPEPFVSASALQPKWQKNLKAKDGTTTSVSSSDRVWGKAAFSGKAGRTSHGNDENRSSGQRSWRKNDKFSRNYEQRREQTPKPRVFGPDGIKDL